MKNKLIAVITTLTLVLLVTMGTCFATSPLIISKRAAESIKQSLSRYDQLGKYEKDTIRVYLKTGG